MLGEYFSRDLAQLIERTTIITPQIAFSSTEGFILNEDGVLLNNLGYSITKITQIDYTSSILTVLDTEGRCRRRSPQDLICLTTVQTDVVQLAGRYFLLHDGTVAMSTSNHINIVPSAKDIVQITPHYDRVLTLNNKYGAGYIFQNTYTPRILSVPVVKLHNRIAELFDRSLMIVYIDGRNLARPVQHIKSSEDIYLDVNHKLTAMTSYFNYLRKIKPELDTRSTLCISVLDFVKTDRFLVILKTNGEVLMWGQNRNKLFGLPVDLSVPRLVIENRPTIINVT